MAGILALDLATRFGWAWLPAPDAEPRYGTYKLPSTGEDIGRFLNAYEDWFAEALGTWEPEQVAFEAPLLLHPGKTNIATARKLMCLAGVTESMCVRRRIPCYEGHLQEVKKFFAGHGRADKGQMIAACQARGWRPTDDNSADALGLMCWAVSRFHPRSKHALPALLRVGA